MGRRGPAPKPTALRLVEGNPGHRPINASEPRPRRIRPARPAWLPKDARREWHRLVGELDRLGLLTAVDGAAFAAYCMSYANWVRAERVILEKGLTYDEPRFVNQDGSIVSVIKARPEVAIAIKEKAAMRAYAREFGLTPSARTGFSLRPPGDEDDADLDPS